MCQKKWFYPLFLLAISVGSGEMVPATVDCGQFSKPVMAKPSGFNR